MKEIISVKKIANYELKIIKVSDTTCNAEYYCEVFLDDMSVDCSYCSTLEQAEKYREYTAKEITEFLNNK